ncbi:hypothetical protein [Nostoc sp. GT001]|uniref:tetratricopeptide repeat protein n=1 Tax=Nostoc sp. GT001 TaxID=3056647 RepID=UPI0025AA7A4C|nr:hypothetical protein [Nostoc sp. GT001]MDM9581553.1 hypothetical protein [Nostoc sp. GT001]
MAQGSVQVITGTIVQKQNSPLEIAARYQQTTHISEVHAYKITQKLQDSNKKSDLSDMIKELAYRIALDLSQKALSTHSWEAFKFFTEALHQICHYERTKSINDLNKAKKLCLDAKKYDINYIKIGEMLSLIGLCYLSIDQYKDAKNALYEAMQISPNSPSILTVYGTLDYYLGEYEQALKHYKHAKDLKPDSYEIQIKIGIIQAIHGQYVESRKNFLESRLLECDNRAARSALAWLDFLCHLDELKNGTERKANSRLEKAYKGLDKIIRSRDITNIDYGNLAIVLLYKGGKENVKNAYENWRKAFQSCPNRTTSDKIKHIFYELLVRSETIDRTGIIDQKLSELNQLLQNQILHQEVLPHAVISDILKNAKIIWKKCMDNMKNTEAEKLLISRILTNSIIFNLKYEKIEISGSEMIFDFTYEEIEILDSESYEACFPAEEHRQLELFMRKLIVFLERSKNSKNLCSHNPIFSSEG